MENVKIFLSGSMTGLTLSQQMKWRQQFIDAIKFGNYDYIKMPIIFSPPLYYSPETNNHKSEREAMEFELDRLRKSDLVVVNFNNPSSIGTSMEIAIAHEYRIPIIGLNKDDATLHPWLIECCTRICDSMKELVEHVCNYYLQ